MIAKEDLRDKPYSNPVLFFATLDEIKAVLEAQERELREGMK